ncbi:MAG: hypothetical protein ACK559_42115, partial [bacterium]
PSALILARHAGRGVPTANAGRASDAVSGDAVCADEDLKRHSGRSSSSCPHTLPRESVRACASVRV